MLSSLIVFALLASLLFCFFWFLHCLLCLAQLVCSQFDLFTCTIKIWQACKHFLKVGCAPNVISVLTFYSNSLTFLEIRPWAFLSSVRWKDWYHSHWKQGKQLARQNLPTSTSTVIQITSCEIIKQEQQNDSPHFFCMCVCLTVCAWN